MKVRINLRFVFTEKGFHKKIAKVLAFPDYYGKNLDALFDLLMEKNQPQKIEFVNWQHFAKKNNTFMQKLQRVFENIAAEGGSVSAEYL